MLSTCLGSAAALFAFYKADESRKMVKVPFIYIQECVVISFFLSFIRRFGHQYQDTKYDLNYIPVLSLSA